MGFPTGLQTGICQLNIFSNEHYGVRNLETKLPALAYVCSLECLFISWYA